MGLVCASVHILLLMLFIPFPFSDTLGKRLATHSRSSPRSAPQEGISIVEFPHHLVGGRSPRHTVPDGLIVCKVISILVLPVVSSYGYPAWFLG